MSGTPEAGLKGFNYGIKKPSINHRIFTFMKINSESELRALYNQPSERAVKKSMNSLEKHATNFINTSPFFILSTVGFNGKIDASPRGGKPGFVKILNEKQIVFHDSRGNNRLDSLVNILESKSMGTLFLIPGIDETLRINGKASISVDPEHINLFASEKNTPKVCVLIDIEEVFLHCAKALMRSELWSIDSQIKRKDFPTMGQMLKDQIGGAEKAESHDDMVKRYEKDL